MTEFYNKVLFFKHNLKETKLIIPFFLKHYKDTYPLNDLQDYYKVCEKIIFYCMVDCLNTYTYDDDTPKFPNQSAIKNKVKHTINLLQEYNSIFINDIKGLVADFIYNEINNPAVINLTNRLLDLFINNYQINKSEICVSQQFNPDDEIRKATINKDSNTVLSFYKNIENKLKTYFYDKDINQFAFKNFLELDSYLKFIENTSLDDNKILELSFLNIWKYHQEEYRTFKNYIIDTIISPNIISDLKIEKGKVEMNPMKESAIQSYKDKEEREKKQEEIKNFKLSKEQKLAKLNKFVKQFEEIIKLDSCAGAEKKMDVFFADLPNKNSQKIIALIRNGLNKVGIYDENKSSVSEIEESINQELENNDDE